MNKIQITKKFSFEAAHYLPEYQGDCANLHGHSYFGEVTVSFKKPVKSIKFVMDFKILKSLINKVIIEKYDHKNLNDIFYFPSVEATTLQIFKDFRTNLKLNHESVQLEKVLLHETQDSYCEVIR